ncbi:MAG: hypothetical protein Q8N42_02120, partial [bacterium]|nr:hypothetical protein [bacterium]
FPSDDNTDTDDTDEAEGEKFSFRTRYTNEQLLAMYHRLPKDVQEAILSVDTSEAIREIGEKHKLMVDKIGDLADETGLVMLGVTRPSQYVPHLIERLEVSQEAAQEITEEVNNRILFPIRDSLRKIQQEREELAETIPEEPLLVGGEKPVTETPSPASPAGGPAFETATFVPPPLTLPETLTPPPPAGGLPSADWRSEEPAIFQAKTKEEIFRLPLQTVEKMPDLPKTPEKPSFAEASADTKALADKPEGKKFDPYKEPIS